MGRNPCLRLDVKTPSLFRCPISLEVMQSPVSLCTGVTYDRCSIQRWLDSGNTTCPATMLPLPSTDLVPNLTLRRLIGVWSSSLLLPPPISSSPAVDELLNQPSQGPTLPVLGKLEEFFMDDDIDESVKNGVVDADTSSLLVSVLNGMNNNNKSMITTAIRVLSLILTAGFVNKCNKEITVSSLLSEPDSTVSSVVLVLLDRSSSPESRTAAGRVLDVVLSAASPETKISVTRKEERLVYEIIGLVQEGGTDDVDAGLSCLTSLWSTSKLKPTIVQAGAVAALVRALLRDPPPSGPAMERAMVMLEAAAASCMDGQAAVGERMEECVEAAVGRIMKVGKAGREAAVGVLWGVCYGAGGEKERRRAREAVVGSSGAMAKILVVMQGDCSPRVTRMAGDLLRLFRVGGKSRLAAGYDTWTTHIRPF